MGEIRSHARLVVVGEAPGRHEVENGRPFVGQSGVELNTSLERGGLSRDECTITNVILCQPPEDFENYLNSCTRESRRISSAAVDAGQSIPSAPFLSPVECCAPRLELDIQESCSRTYLAVGGQALRAFARRYSVPYGTGADTVGRVAFATIKAQHGSPVVMQDGTIVCSSLHPAFALRENRQYTTVIREQIARAATIARTGVIDWREPEMTTPDRWGSVDVAISSISSALASFESHKDVARLTIDIETDSADSRTCRIRCVGMGMNIDGDEKIVVIPLLWRDGRRWWANIDDEEAVRLHMRRVIDACHLTFHNGAFDSNVLLREGLMSDRNKIWFDTMIAHHDTDSNDLPHDLGFVARQYFSVPLWKKDVDHKDAAGVGTDTDLWIYNARDVLCTDRISRVVQDRVVACGNVAQFRVDSRLAPVARDMGLLGLWIDETVRGDMSAKFNKLSRECGARFQGLVGKDINPRSVPQLREWIYDDLKLPKYDREGHEMPDDTDEDASTSNGAIFKLIDMGLAPEIATALNTLLEYRAIEKIRGTYVDGLRVDYTSDNGSKSRVSAVKLGDDEILPERPEYSRLYVTWKIHTIPTGRWASQPACQNWPSRGWVVDGKATNTRSMVVAPPGHVLVGADYEQIEARIYAISAGDRYVLKGFKDGLDVHSLNAATIFAKSESEIMPLYEKFAAAHFKYQKQKPATDAEKEEASYVKYVRTVAKRVMYLECYGGEEEMLFSTMASERDKATNRRTFPNLDKRRVGEWQERWTRYHVEMKSWQRRIAYEVRRDGFVRSLLESRRARYFIGGPNKKNAPPNHQIQASAAEMANAAVLRIAEKIPFGSWSKWTGLCLQIHDYLGVYVPENRAEEAKKIVEECMYFEMPTGEGWVMPFPAEAKVSRSWADNA